MFSLKKQPCRVAHLNVREEKHGEEPVLAVDIKIVADVPNTLLDQLSPGLRSALYAKEGQQSGETADIEADHLAVLRYPQLDTLKWEVGYVGAKFAVQGATKESRQEFSAKIDTVALALKEGGTVEIAFQAKTLPTPDQSGALAGFLGGKAKVWVEPVAQPELPPSE